MSTVTLKREKTKKFKCVTSGFMTRVYPWERNEQYGDYIGVQNREILESDEYGCIRKDGISICHKDSCFAKIHFRECDENGAVKKSKKKKRRIKRGK